MKAGVSPHRLNGTAAAYGSRPSPGRRTESPSIIRPQIIRDAVWLVEIVPVIGIAIQQRAGLGLVIRRYIVGLRQAAAENVAIILVVRFGADEDADAVDRFGIEIADVAAVLVDHEAVRRQRVQRLLPRLIIGDLDTEAGRRQQKTVLVEERFARHL